MWVIVFGVFIVTYLSSKPCRRFKNEEKSKFWKCTKYIMQIFNLKIDFASIKTSIIYICHFSILVSYIFP